MDEPCSALDPMATLRVEELMQELEENYTIVIVTHNMQQAARGLGRHRLHVPRASSSSSAPPTRFSPGPEKLTEDYIPGSLGEWKIFIIYIKFK